MASARNRAGRQQRSRRQRAPRQSNGARNGNGNRRRDNTRPLRQGVAEAPRGGVMTRVTQGPKVHGSLCHYFDATSPSHLPLPRAIGPYITLKTSTLIVSTDKVCVFGSFAWNGRWTSTCCLSSVNSALAINATENTRRHEYPLHSLASGIETMVPAAVTVQVMNPGALQDTTGTVLGSVLNYVPIQSTDLSTWTQWADRVVSYNQPRLMAAAKLALRGVKASCVPMDMNDLSDFSHLYQSADPSVFTNDWLDAHGFAPIFVYNPNAISLNYLVTTEWRCRFDAVNPAVSTHIKHNSTPPSFHDKVVNSIPHFGVAFKELADVVADVGIAAATVRPLLRLGA